MNEKINKPWHDKNILGQNAPLAKRINWHLQHQENCRCHTVPRSITDAVKGKEVKTCNRRHKFIGKGPCLICWPEA